MVSGLESFREKFRGFEDCYTVIGGAACDILMSEADLPFKMYAWLDLRRRKANGEHVNEKDYKKHKNDVFRLIQIINAETQIKITGLVKESIDLFITYIAEEPVRVEQFGLPLTMDDALDILQKKYI